MVDKNPLMTAAWAGFLSWAIRRREFLVEFRAMTGHDLVTSRNPLDRMIDRATGYTDDTDAKVLAFIDWVTERYWGLSEAPAAYRKDRIKRLG